MRKSPSPEKAQKEEKSQLRVEFDEEKIKQDQQQAAARKPAVRLVPAVVEKVKGEKAEKEKGPDPEGEDPVKEGKLSRREKRAMKGKGKGKMKGRTPHEGPRGQVTRKVMVR